MPGFDNNFTNPNLMDNNYTTMQVNQLVRQKNSIDNMLNALLGNNNNQPNNQAPVQNFINTNNTNGSDIDVRFLNEGEDFKNIIVAKRTIFIDEPNCQICIKELDGKISKTYKIIVPKDEKDLKIEELESKLKALEERINGVRYNESTTTSKECGPAITILDKSTKSASQG